ncbi:hypothetical protein PT974_00850 [Cladobotryum mycophilum]|uniref:Uncharacterized protein n=1 Tax=Cladobotryum mycophilum TaxID=491253 RepID=A0ABR0T216_9HYPO
MAESGTSHTPSWILAFLQSLDRPLAKPGYTKFYTNGATGDVRTSYACTNTVYER